MIVASSLLLAIAACSSSDSQSGLDPSNLTASGYFLTPPASVAVSPASASVTAGSTVQLSTTIKNAAGDILTGLTGTQVIWSSGDTTIAKVSQTGLVTGVHAGSVTITATDGSVDGTSAVRVNAAPATSTPTTSTPPSSSQNPPSSSGSISSGLSGKAFLYDDYTGYANTQAFLNNVSSNIGGTGSPNSVLYNDGFNPQLTQIDNTVLYNGHQTLKYNQLGNSSSTPQLWVGFPGGKTLTNMWVRVKLRYSPGYTTYGTTPNCANAYKLLGWGWAGTDGRGSLEFTNTNQYVFEWYVDNTTKTQLGEVTAPSGPHTKTEWTDGRWYDYIIHYAQMSSTSITMSWWLAPDGQTPVMQQTTTGTMTTGQAPPVNRVLLGLNFNSLRPASETEAIWYGQWEVVDGSQYSNPFGVN